MRNLSSSLFVAMVMLTVFSCRDTNVVSQEKAPAEPQMIDGRIVFPSQEAFRKTITSLAEGQNRKEQNSLDAFEARYPGFVSMRTAYNALTEEDAEQLIKQKEAGGYSSFAVEEGLGEEREITRVIGDPLLATVVNAKGWVQIGSDLFKFKRDKFIVVKSNASARLAQVDSGLESGSDIVTGRITRQSSPAGSNARKASDNCLQEYWIGSGWFGSQKRRMAGVIEWETYDYYGTTLYTDVYLYTKHQKRVLGVSWWEVNAPSMSLQYRIKISDMTNPRGGQFVDQVLSSTDDGMIQQSFPSYCSYDPNTGSTLCQFFFTEVSTTHRVVCSDGVSRQCNLAR